MVKTYEKLFLVFFLFKQKTAYEMRISDWSSDVCSSDLIRQRATEYRQRQAEENRKYLAGFEDTAAFLRDGGSLPENPYSRDQLVARLGAEEGGSLADEMEGAAEFGQAVSAVKWATPEEIDSLITAEAADLSTAEGYKNPRAEMAHPTRAVE